MASEPMETVRELAWHRRGRGLTQADLARLLGVTQQTVAKWEAGGVVPTRRLKSIARHLRVPVAALLPPDEGPAEVQAANVRASMAEFFADQVVVCFDGRCLHYCPSAEELQAFWKNIQRGAFAHLSAGPIQVMLNVGAALRVDISEDPPLNSYTPTPVSPVDDDDQSDEGESEGDGAESDSAEGGAVKEPERWWHRGEARILLRGAPEPYSGPQTFFDDVLDRNDISREELAELYDAFESERSTSNSIFDLYDAFLFSADMDESEYERGQRLHVDTMHVFQSEDYDGVPQHTWVHTRDIQAIEVPTRLWELHCLSLKARNELLEAEASLAKAKARDRKRTPSRRA